MPSPDPLSTSTSLLNDICCGEQQAWFRFVELYTPLIELWCRRQGIRAVDAEDIVQNVFAVVAIHIQEFGRDRSKNSFRGWLWTITRSKIVDHIRSAARQPDTFGDAGLLPAWAVAASIETNGSPDSDNDLQARLARALEIIRQDFLEQTWQAFWLTGVLGWRPRDVAIDLGMTAAAVCMSRARVMRRLRETIQTSDL